MAAKVVVEGIPELLRQFPEIQQRILEAANEASIKGMQPALSAAKSTRLFQDRGRRISSKGNPAHPAGNLRSKLQLFVKENVKRGKQRVWASLGVPYGQGAAYYIPLELGHVKRNRRDAKKFLEEAYKAAAKNGEQEIVRAINGVLADYPPEPPKGGN